MWLELGEFTMEITQEHYATLRESCLAYSNRFGRIDDLVASARSEGFQNPYRWAGYYVLSYGRHINGYMAMLREYMTDAEIDEAVVRAAIDAESSQREYGHYLERKRQRENRGTA
jgi:hypothetical protein